MEAVSAGSTSAQAELLSNCSLLHSTAILSSRKRNGQHSPSNCPIPIRATTISFTTTNNNSYYPHSHNGGCYEQLAENMAAMESSKDDGDDASTSPGFANNYSLVGDSMFVGVDEGDGGGEEGEGGGHSVGGIRLTPAEMMASEQEHRVLTASHFVHGLSNDCGGLYHGDVDSEVLTAFDLHPRFRHHICNMLTSVNNGATNIYFGATAQTHFPTIRYNASAFPTKWNGPFAGAAGSPPHGFLLPTTFPIGSRRTVASGHPGGAATEDEGNGAAMGTSLTSTSLFINHRPGCRLERHCHCNDTGILQLPASSEWQLNGCTTNGMGQQQRRRRLSMEEALNHSLIHVHCDELSLGVAFAHPPDALDSMSGNKTMATTTNNNNDHRDEEGFVVIKEHMRSKREYKLSPPTATSSSPSSRQQHRTAAAFRRLDEDANYAINNMPATYRSGPSNGHPPQLIAMSLCYDDGGIRERASTERRAAASTSLDEPSHLAPSNATIIELPAMPRQEKPNLLRRHTNGAIAIATARSQPVTIGTFKEQDGHSTARARLVNIGTHLPHYSQHQPRYHHHSTLDRLDELQRAVELEEAHHKERKLVDNWPSSNTNCCLSITIAPPNGKSLNCVVGGGSGCEGEARSNSPASTTLAHKEKDITTAAVAATANHTTTSSNNKRVEDRSAATTAGEDLILTIPASGGNQPIQHPPHPQPSASQSSPYFASNIPLYHQFNNHGEVGLGDEDGSVASSHSHLINGLFLSGAATTEYEPHQLNHHSSFTYTPHPFPQPPRRVEKHVLYANRKMMRRRTAGGEALFNCQSMAENGQRDYGPGKFPLAEPRIPTTERGGGSAAADLENHHNHNSMGNDEEENGKEDYCPPTPYVVLSTPTAVSNQQAAAHDYDDSDGPVHEERRDGWRRRKGEQARGAQSHIGQHHYQRYHNNASPMLNNSSSTQVQVIRRDASQSTQQKRDPHSHVIQLPHPRSRSQPLHCQQSIAATANNPLLCHMPTTPYDYLPPCRDWDDGVNSRGELLLDRDRSSVDSVLPPHPPPAPDGMGMMIRRRGGMPPSCDRNVTGEGSGSCSTHDSGIRSSTHSNTSAISSSSTASTRQSSGSGQSSSSKQSRSKRGIVPWPRETGAQSRGNKWQQRDKLLAGEEGRNNELHHRAPRLGTTTMQVSSSVDGGINVGGSMAGVGGQKGGGGRESAANAAGEERGGKARQGTAVVEQTRSRMMAEGERAIKKHSSNNNKELSPLQSTCSSPMLLVEAVWDHVAMLADELPFSAGDIITVVDAQSTQSGLWYGVCRERSGWFPAAYVRVRDPHDHFLLKKLEREGMGDCTRKGDDGGSSGSMDSGSVPSTASNKEESLEENSSDSDDFTIPSESFPPAMRYLRRKIVEELVGTERDYVQLLANLAEGFVEQCRRRGELFSDERIQRVFGNLVEIRELHVKLLRDVEASLNRKSPETSCMATPFLRHGHCFGIYTEYCNNRPVSCAELAALEANPQYHHFFEACRLLRGMPKLTLEGFLLTPVQRICRYPLQLMELLKATPSSHPDRRQLEQAHRTMRAVAAHINDSKRRLDAIQKIILWQRNVIGFRGPDLVDNNHKMLNSGEMHCRALARSQVQWSKTVHVYLFDQSIVLCKKDVLKKSALIFKERMSLQGVSVTDLNDGKEQITSVVLKNSFKLSGPMREYLFTCPDPGTKSLWLEALRSRPRPTPPSPAEKRLAFITLNQ